MAITAEIASAIEELTASFPSSTVTAVEDGTGGAWVTVDPVELGETYEPSNSWIGFHMTFGYPDADVYPHFVIPDLKRADHADLGEGFGQTEWGPDGARARATQLSRRSNRWNPAFDNATVKLHKVLQWLTT